MYEPIEKKNQILCGTGNTAVITGWTPIKAVEKYLNPEEYGSIGQLYSPTRGINYLVRNLLANPQIRYLALLLQTEADRNSGAIEVLLWFLHYGFRPGATDLNHPAWIIDCDWESVDFYNNFNFKGLGYIDLEIPEADLNLLRKSLNWTVSTNIKDCINEVWGFQKQKLTLLRSSKVYPVQEKFLPSILPGQRYGHRIEGRTIAETWVKIIHRIKTTGTIRSTSYDGYWQELIDLMAVVTDEPDDFYFPEPNYLPVDREFIKQYKAQILDDAPYKESVKYTYGQRLRSWFKRDQIEQVINKLIGEIDAASAVMSLWDVADHDSGGSPCLNHVWLRVVDNELSMTATFRSNDMFSAWPANAMGLRALQKYIRDAIADRSEYDIRMGPLITVSQSAHIYNDCWEYAVKLIAEQYDRISKKRSFADPGGSFLISLDRKQGLIKVEHISPTPGDEMLQTFTGKNPQKLTHQIVKTCPVLENSHCCYLGIEIQKAYQCLMDNSEYSQL
jgi:thymidylate synthase